jgi:hypothetical protein
MPHTRTSGYKIYAPFPEPAAIRLISSCRSHPADRARHRPPGRARSSAPAARWLASSAIRMPRPPRAPGRSAARRSQVCGIPAAAARSRIRARAGCCMPALPGPAGNLVQAVPRPARPGPQATPPDRPHLAGPESGGTQRQVDVVRTGGPARRPGGRGWKLAAAVPGVRSAAAGRPLALARPRGQEGGRPLIAPDVGAGVLAPGGRPPAASHAAPAEPQLAIRSLPSAQLGAGQDHPGELSQTLVGSNPWIDGTYTALCT